jgi:hypothetical protein
MSQTEQAIVRDETAKGNNARLFGRVIRAMILRPANGRGVVERENSQFGGNVCLRVASGSDRRACLPERCTHRAAVARVGTVELPAVRKHDCARTAALR